jgi:hypothetical protein
VRARLKPAEIQEWLHRWAGPSAGPAQRLAIPLARAGYGAALLCAPGAVIDFLHAASELAFAARYKSLRRAELADALVAAALAVAEPTLARRPANGG